MAGAGMLGGAHCLVEGTRTLGIWESDYSAFAMLDHLAPDGPKLQSIAFDDKGVLWGVTDVGEVVRWQNAAGGDNLPWTPSKWINVGLLGNRTVKMLTWQAATMYGLLDTQIAGTSVRAPEALGPIVKWDQYHWTDAGYASPDAGISSIAWDRSTTPQLWCVAANAVRKLDPTYNQWEDYGYLGEQKLEMLTFDGNNVMWGVNTVGGIVSWNAGDMTAVPPKVPGWKSAADSFSSLTSEKIAWLTFRLLQQT